MEKAISMVTGHFSTDPVLVVRSFYMVAAGAVTVLNTFPGLQQRFVSYGARSTDIRDEDGRPIRPEPSSGPISQALDLVASFKVPHSWFTHFYVVSVASSIFWAQQIAMNGFAFQFLARQYMSSSYRHPTMSAGQVWIVWLLMTIQGSRRLYECITLSKPSTSKMSGPAWVLGILFYLFMGVTIWVEAIPSLLPATSSRSPWLIFRLVVGIPLFFGASIGQHDCHAHLASLKKYSLPTDPMFRQIISPHYTCECLIYFAIALIGAPQGQLFNKSVTTALFFEVINLGVTAESTRVWYSKKFGEDSIKGRWRMFPYMY